MKPPLVLSIILVAMLVSVFASYAQDKQALNDQLESDIKAIVDAVDAEEREDVGKFLRGPGSLDDLSTLVAMNALNGFNTFKGIREPVYRVLHRTASDLKKDEGIRFWAFGLLRRLANHDKGIAVKVRTFAKALAASDDDPLKKDAGKYLTQLEAVKQNQLKVGKIDMDFFKPREANWNAPDPAEQTDAERLATLRKEIATAIDLLEKKKDVQFHERYIDPFWLARYSAENDLPINEMLKNLLSDKRPLEKARERFLTTLRKTLDQKPNWRLGGRAASFISDRGGSHSAEFWIFFEGRWRISPET